MPLFSILEKHTCCKLQIVFKNKTRLDKNFHFKEWIVKDLTSCVVYKLHCELFHYGECVRHVNVRTGEHIGIARLTKKQAQEQLRRGTITILQPFITILVL